MIPAWAAFENPGVDLGLLVDGTIVTAGILCMLPTSRGSAKLLSTDPTDNVLVDPNYFDTEVDKVILRQGMLLNVKAFENKTCATAYIGKTIWIRIEEQAGYHLERELEGSPKAQPLVVYML